jgi:hypothetical protein
VTQNKAVRRCFVREGYIGLGMMTLGIEGENKQEIGPSIEKPGIRHTQRQQEEA